MTLFKANFRICPESMDNDVTFMAVKVFQIIGNSTVCSKVYSSKQQKHQNFALLALCEGNPPVTGEFPQQMASNAESVSMWWRHGGLFQSGHACPLVREFWHTWGQTQLASKVFPMAVVGRSPGQLGPLACPALAALTGSPGPPYMQVPIKEGLRSIIKCLKAQELETRGKAGHNTYYSVSTILHGSFSTKIFKRYVS